MTISANFHTHTTFCDGKATPEEMVQQAMACGFTQIGFSGHMDANVFMDIGAYYAEIRRLQELYKDRIEILRGIELDNMYDPACAYDAEYIIGSTHMLDLPTEKPMAVDSSMETLRRLCEEYFAGDFYRLTAHYYDLEARVYDRLHCTFVGHFDLICKYNDRYHYVDEADPRYYGPALKAMEYLVREGVPFELSTTAKIRAGKADFYPNTFLLKTLHDLGGEILISSDAHRQEQLNAGFEEAVEAAREAGFDHVNYLTKQGTGQVHLLPVRI